MPHDPVAPSRTGVGPFPTGVAYPVAGRNSVGADPMAAWIGDDFVPKEFGGGRFLQRVRAGAGRIQPPSHACRRPLPDNRRWRDAVCLGPFPENRSCEGIGGKVETKPGNRPDGRIPVTLTSSAAGSRRSIGSGGEGRHPAAPFHGNRLSVNETGMRPAGL